MRVNEPFHGRIAGDIHDQVDSMVAHQFIRTIGNRNAKMLRPLKPRGAGVAIRNSDDFDRRNLVEQVEESHASSSCSENRHFDRRELFYRRSVSQVLHC
jgi:reverse gyrase